MTESTAVPFVAAAAASLVGELEDWGFRAGAGEGECKISGLFLSKADDIKTGIWECSPGGFDVPNRANSESVYILSGLVRITDLVNGTVSELGAGDGLVLPKGSSVRWDVLETTRKFFVIAP
eukprot:TRINITY_DN4796_c0_g1_i4.p1 TRINITY_DN4796_c0_g1~~TRINITY_DN4796_c0_g1_i4.p1  ORF type:complete len:122 (+),score=28.28 TRINITY_DN4796_c0_g1_i4:171-536(+)